MASEKESSTAAELMARLEADPEWVKKRDDRARARRQRFEENRRDAEPVIEALANIGLQVASVADLYNHHLNYQRAIPVLIDWLPRIDNPAVKESIVRALTVDWARPAAACVLIDEFRRADDPSGAGLRWAIGNALSQVADDSVFDDVVDLAEDRRWGKAREMVAVALGNMRDRRAVDVLRYLLNDNEVAGHAMVALGRLRAAQAQTDLEPFLRHPEAWVRGEAKKALENLDRDRHTGS